MGMNEIAPYLARGHLRFAYVDPFWDLLPHKLPELETLLRRRREILELLLGQQLTD
ncbi:hypothetical protein D3C72_2409610 [compost metagenome]